MKKRVLVVLALIFALCLAACQKNTETDAPVATKAPETTEATATPEPTEEPEATATPEPTEEPEATVTPEPTEEPEATVTPEPTEEPEATATPEPTEEPEPTATPKPTKAPESALPKNAQVLKNIDASTQVVHINGGVVVTKKNDLYGAMNLNGEEIVPNQYAGYYHHPTNKGYFAMGGTDKYSGVTVFDKNGKVVKELEEGYNHMVISGDLIAWNPDMYTCMTYNIETKKETDLRDFYDMGGYDNNPQFLCLVGDRIISGHYVYEIFVLALKEITEDKSTYLGTLPIENSFINADTADAEGRYLLYGDYEINSELLGFVDLNTDNRSDKSSVSKTPTFQMCMVDVGKIAADYVGIDVTNDAWSYDVAGTPIDGAYRYGMNKILPLLIKDKDAKKHYFLINFDDAKVDQDGCVTNLKDVIKGEYESLSLSQDGYHLVKKDGKWFHVDDNGKKLTSYDDCSRFVEEGYAAVLKDGKAYLIDSKLKELPTGLEADTVDASGNGLVIKKGDMNTYIAFGEKASATKPQATPTPKPTEKPKATATPAPMKDNVYSYKVQLQEEWKEFGIEYKFEADETVTILGFAEGSANDLVIIPEDIAGRPVRTIGKDAFAKSGAFIPSLPETITKIEDSAFEECTFGSQVVLPSGLKYIGKHAFYKALVNEFILPEGIEEVGKDAFGEIWVLNKILIPNNISSVGDWGLIYHVVTIQTKKGTYAEEFARLCNIKLEIIK